MGNNKYSGENAIIEQKEEIDINSSSEIKSPIDFLKENWEKSLEEHKEKISNLNYIEQYSYILDEKYTRPPKNDFLFGKYGIIFSLHFNDKYRKLKLKKITNFIIKEVATVKHIYNNKSGNPNKEYYILTLENNKGYKKSNIEIEGNAKSEFQKFQEKLNLADNNFQIMCSQREFKTLFEKYIQPKLTEKIIIIYENCGKIKANTFLGGDFLIENGTVFRGNEDGLIPTSVNNVFIKANDKQAFRLPKISRSDKSGQIIAKDFIQNILDSWGNNYIYALLAIGHMIMGLYVEHFTNKSTGTPIMILSGVSGSGKSTIIKNGISIFGFGDDLLLAGNSTVLSQQFIANKINGANVCVDDLSDTIIESNGFGQTIKNQYNSTPRARKVDYGKNIFLEYPCSQIVYSTNSTLPEVDALENRVNLISIMKNYLDTDKYNYLPENAKNNEDLSLILPELLKLDESEIVKRHKNLVEKIKEKIDKKVPRIAHNTAYMWCGIQLLEKIANVKFENLDDEIIKYAKEAVERYKSIPNEVDKLLNGLLTLKELGKIEENTHYNLKNQDNRIYIMFHKGTLIKIHNDNFSCEQNQKISLTCFKNWLKNDERVINHSITGYYNGKRKSSIIIDITDNPDVWEFTGYPEPVNPNNNNDLSEISNVINNIT